MDLRQVTRSRYRLIFHLRRRCRTVNPSAAANSPGDAADAKTANDALVAAGKPGIDVQAFKTKFDTVIDRATELVRKGVPKDQLLSQIKTDDIGWTPRIPGIDAFIAELSK